MSVISVFTLQFYPIEEVVYLREIAAQKYLLAIKEKYKIPESETKETESNLKAYEEKLEKIREERR